MEKIVNYTDYSSTILSGGTGKITLVGGCFDIVHLGHITFLKNAKRGADTLIIALESDEFIIRNKSRQPFMTQYERAQILAGIRYVDLVIMLPFFANSSDYEILVKKVRPNKIAVTKGDPFMVEKKRFAKLIGASVEIVAERISTKTTTQLIKAVNEISGK